MTTQDDRHWLPATFQERGVAVGFTSPLLAGARIRHAERRCELLVPHPGGARGVYIFALASLGEFCTPTLHDQHLAERLAGLRSFGPAAVRAVARAVAAEGLAGRAAAASAERARAQEAETAARHEASLFRSMLQQAGDVAKGGAPDACAARALQLLSRRTGRAAEAVRADIALLSQSLAQCGLDEPGEAPDRRGRAARLLDTIETMRTGILAWAGGGSPDSPSFFLTEAAGCVRAAGQALLRSTCVLLTDRTALLHAWAANPEQVTARLSRADWLLDGWEHLSLLWQVAESDDQRVDAVSEAAALVPPLPTEAELWLGQPAATLAPLRPRGAPGPGNRLSVRPPSQLVGLVSRNERILARAA